jgi:hypothetical protein
VCLPSGDYPIGREDRRAVFVLSRRLDFPTLIVDWNVANLGWWRSFLFGLAKAEVFKDAEYRNCVVRVGDDLELASTLRADWPSR